MIDKFFIESESVNLESMKGIDSGSGKIESMESNLEPRNFDIDSTFEKIRINFVILRFGIDSEIGKLESTLHCGNFQINSGIKKF